MITTPIAILLVAHGLIHLAIWAPPPPAPERPVPFVPDRSPVLTASRLPQTEIHSVALRLALVVTLAFALAGIATAFGAAWTPVAAACAAVLGLVLKLLFFHPWLTIGVLLDLAVLAAAVSGWPFSLT
jgi:hypothetical protein